MKKIILFLSLVISGIYLINFISAINIKISSGNILNYSTWGEIASITNKIEVSSNDIKINGKVYISGKLCDSSGKCLGDKSGTENNPGLSCKDLYDNQGVRKDGTYHIKPTGYAGNAVEVYCDMTFDGCGWTRYADIKGNYSFNDAYSCWQKSDGTNIGTYTNLDCFNPNRYNMSATSMMMKKDSTNYIKNITLTPSTIAATTGGGYHCLGGENYMTIMGTSTPTSISNTYRIRLGLNYCNYNFEYGGVNTTPQYFNGSSSGLGVNGNRENTADKIEIFIK